MRIGFISNFSPGHAECEIADYLELEGHKVARFQHSHLDRKKFLAQSFDMVLTVLPQCYDLEFWQAVKASGATLVAWHSDWIRESQQQGPYLRHLSVFDQVFSFTGPACVDSTFYAVTVDELHRRMEWLLTIDTAEYSRRARRQAEAHSWESKDIDYKKVWMKTLGDI